MTERLRGMIGGRVEERKREWERLKCFKEKGREREVREMKGRLKEMVRGKKSDKWKRENIWWRSEGKGEKV